jgi:integrase
MYVDGGGLYLQVTQGKEGRINKSWLYRYATPHGERYMGLGSQIDVTLAEAREKAKEARQLRRDKIDPIEHRREKAQAAALAKAKDETFKQTAEAYIATHRAGWKSPKHAAQWSQSLETFAYPVIGDLSVRAVDTDLIKKVLAPIWTDKPVTASRLRGRIELILGAAVTNGTRAEGPNPARWRGHLETIFMKVSAAKKAKRVRTGRPEHHPALPYDEIGSFMADLRSREGIAARALEFAILNGGRTEETRCAQWAEFDLINKMWIIPADRMKASKEHRVPLSAPALAILQKMKAVAEGKFVFAGHRDGKPLSDMALLQVIRRMNGSVPKWVDSRQHNAPIVTHGFRSSFMDWAHEQTNFPREAIDMALAHTVSDKVEAAYRRGDMLEKRRQLMAAWAHHCEGKQSAKVVPLKAG